MTFEQSDEHASRRFKNLTSTTNRQFAYAVVYGEMSRDEAGAFSRWVVNEGLTDSEPADNLDLYFGVD